MEIDDSADALANKGQLSASDTEPGRMRGRPMGIFAKAPLDDDFERALHGNGARNCRKEISKAQQLIRSSLGPGEQLRFIFCGEFIWNWTLVFTSSRLLVFKSFEGFKSGIEALAYACQPQDILDVSFGPLRSGDVYGAVIDIRQTTDRGILVKTSMRRDAELIGHIAGALMNERRL